MDYKEIVKKRDGYQYILLGVYLLEGISALYVLVTNKYVLGGYWVNNWIVINIAIMLIVVGIIRNFDKKVNIMLRVDKKSRRIK